MNLAGIVGLPTFVLFGVKHVGWRFQTSRAFAPNVVSASTSTHRRDGACGISLGTESGHARFRALWHQSSSWNVSNDCTYRAAKGARLRLNRPNCRPHRTLGITHTAEGY